VEEANSEEMYLKACAISLVSPHVTMVACNALTVRFFAQDRYTPSLVTLIENTVIHGLLGVVLVVIVVKGLRDRGGRSLQE